ncbi:hypothetical protein [Streptomyces sp. NPDC058254]|uniref:hypothetical protein n=1 Tax=Streptomyces sp. NPDC058254 TaxID=3346406 RepID=UPI0036E36FB3
MPKKITERVAMARHAASELATWGSWKNGRPTATLGDVKVKTTAMYGRYLTTDITDGEAAEGLRLALAQQGIAPTAA